MGFSFWHWLIVIAISAFAFRHQLSSFIGYLTDPGSAVKDRLGLLHAEEREAMIRKQARRRLKAWLTVVAAFVLMFALEATSYLIGHNSP
jgi:hypothetical protein